MNSKSALAISLSVLMLLGVTIASSRNAYAHTFSGDESASFLATVEVIRVQLDLAKKDLASDMDTAAEHAEHAREHLSNDTIKEITERNNRLGTELPSSLDELHETIAGGNATQANVDEMVNNINNLLDETVAVRIENSQQTNSTVQGTMFADLIDEILESYNGAYGIEENNHDDDSMNMNNSSMDEGSPENSNASTPTDEELEDLTTFELAEQYPAFVNGESGGNETSGNQTNDTIVNMMEYETAQALTVRAQELFDTKLKAMAETNATEAVSALDAGLKKLKQAIDDKAPADEVDTIIHADIHPNIQKAFNLQVIPEFPLPILAAIFGIMSVIAYSRLRSWKKL